MNRNEVKEVYDYFNRQLDFSSPETAALLTIAAYLDDLGDVLLPGFRGKDEIDRLQRINARPERESR